MANGRRGAAGSGVGAERKEKRTYLKQLNKRSAQEHAEIKELDARLAAGAPEPGSNPLSLSQATDGIYYAGAKTFEELPISTYTQVGGRGRPRRPRRRGRRHGCMVPCRHTAAPPPPGRLD